jgi:hypothetical protein
MAPERKESPMKEEIEALVAAAVARTEKERGFVEQMRGKDRCSPKQLHWLRGLAARAEKLKALVNEEEKPAEYDLSNVVAFPGYFCRGKEVLHACIAYKDVDAFAQSISEKDYARCLQWDRARRARNKKLAQQTGNGAA